MEKEWKREKKKMKKGLFLYIKSEWWNSTAEKFLQFQLEKLHQWDESSVLHFANFRFLNFLSIFQSLQQKKQKKENSLGEKQGSVVVCRPRR